MGGGSYTSNGLHIVTNGVVTITAVTVSRNNTSNVWPGLWVQSAGRSVTVKSSEFNDNSGNYGLVIQSNTGAITLQNVYADHNESGMGLSTKGNITLTSVSASYNDNLGADLNTCLQSGLKCTWLGTGKVTINGGTFNYNQNLSDNDPYGLIVVSRGAISLANVSADWNGAADYGDGALLTTQYSQLVSPVAISNSNFNNNHASPLFGVEGNLVVYATGAITLTSVQANANLIGPGAILDNTFGTTAGVTVTGSSTVYSNFNGNGDFSLERGLEIRTNGNVALSYMNAWGNEGDGLFFTTTSPSNVTIKNATFTDNQSYGLRITTRGTITISDISATLNFGQGAKLYNAGSSTPKNITLRNDVFLSNTYTGVWIESTGSIILTNVSSNYNDANGYGVYADNTWGIAGVSISGGNFDDNRFDGIYIRTKGPISVINAVVERNARNGADVRNNSADTAQSVTINGGVFNGNTGGSGLWVETKGTVSLTNITAKNNSIGYGAYIDQRPSSSGLIPTFPSASISTGTFSSNGDSGLFLYGRGTVTLTNITAQLNTGNGAYIENQKGNVSLLASGTSGSSSFSYNVGLMDGLMINTEGTITLNKVTASYNTSGMGVFLYSSTLGSTGNVSINGGTFNGSVGMSQNQGLVVNSHGTIIVNCVTAEDNMFGGITLNNTYDTTGAKGISATRTRVYSNGGNGLEVDSYGTITVNTIIALENIGNGVDLDNHSGIFTTPKGISILGSYGTSNVSGNGSIGLNIRTKGNVIVTKVTANDNTHKGINIDNYTGGGIGTVTLSYLTVNRSGWSGINVSTNNAVALSYSTVMFTKNNLLESIFRRITTT